MSWFGRLLPSRIRTDGASRRSVPEGLWTKCSQCNAVLYRTELERNADVCPKCGHHMRQSARRRLHQFLDQEPRVEIGAEVEPVDVLRFRSGKKYQDQIAKDQKATGEKDALVAMMGRVRGIAVVAVAFEYGFRAGSMGSVVGERFVRAAETAVREGIPLVAFACSGGARMQEGLFALFQMAKTSAALARLQERRLPYVSVLTDPTTGGCLRAWECSGTSTSPSPVRSSASPDPGSSSRRSGRRSPRASSAASSCSGTAPST